MPDQSAEPLVPPTIVKIAVHDATFAATMRDLGRLGKCSALESVGLDG
jgi:hypothetical protein